MTFTTSVCNGICFSGMIFGACFGALASPITRARYSSFTASLIACGSKRPASAARISSGALVFDFGRSTTADEQSSNANTAALGTR